MIPGPSQPRDRPTGLPTLRQIPLLFIPIQRSTRRLNRPLHPFSTRHRPPPTKGRLRIHPRRRRLPCPTLRNGYLYWHLVAEKV